MAYARVASAAEGDVADDGKNAAEQVDFQSTILSRFDMIFIVRDVRDYHSIVQLGAEINRQLQ